MPEDIKKTVVQLFLSGQSVNHIVFLLDYAYRIDEVSAAIRNRLQELETLVLDQDL